MASWFSRLKQGLKKASLRDVFVSREVKETLPLLEERLLMADVGIKTTVDILNALKKENAKTSEDVKNHLKKLLKQKMTGSEKEIDLTGKKPCIFLFMGVNGSGKTTTIGKMAEKFKNQGLSVLMIAADTFRAAATDQLKAWGERTDVPVFSKPQGSDPSGVVFDGLVQGKDKDVVLIDTSGRLPNKPELMAELSKMGRVIKKFDPEAPHESFLVLDATIGQNSFQQVEAFSKTIEPTGLIMTKLDGSAKGGVLVSVFDRFQIPICYIGVGEQTEDLDVFKTDDYLEGILE